MKIYELKALLKEKAATIKALRIETKEMQRKRKNAGPKQYSLLCKKADYRIHHIAYCELRGKTRDQIESPGSKPVNNGAINKIKAAYNTPLYEEGQAA